MTLDGMSLIVVGTASSPAYFTGSVVIGDATVSFKNVTGSTTATNAMVSIDDGKFILSTVTLSKKDDSMTITAGTVYAGKAGTTPVACSVTANDGSVKIADGATLVANTTGISFDELTVDGILSVPANMGMGVTGTLQVNGTVKVDAATSTSAQGVLTVGPVSAGSTGKLFIGISSSDYYKSTGAAASFSGPVAVAGQIIVSSDAAIDDAFKAVLDKIESKTTFNVNGSAWFTAYYNKGASEVDNDKMITVDKIAVQNVELLGWADKDGKKIIPAPAATSRDEPSWKITIGAKENLYAMIDTQVYKIVIKADEGIADVYLNGQAMAYGLVKSGDDFYYAYSSTVAAGSYKVTYTLKNGWSGEAKLAGDNVTGMSFSVSGDYSTDKVYQLTGVEKSGYVEPVTPSEDKSDDGLTITDYLLIVLVVLIVILAVIVAMRLMRS